jgi:hypothetical protein
MMGLGFPVVLLYIFLVPGFIAWTLIRERKAGRLFALQADYDAKSTIRFGFMFAGYREGYEFWECVVMLRKCAFVLLSVFLRQFGTAAQVVSAAIVLFLATSAHLQHRPYLDPAHNWLESLGLHMCLLQLLVTLLSNMIGRVDRNVTGSPLGLQSTVIVIVIVFASTGYFFWHTFKWTVIKSQTVEGLIGQIARRCGRILPCIYKRRTKSGLVQVGPSSAGKKTSTTSRRGPRPRSLSHMLTVHNVQKAVIHEKLVVMERKHDEHYAASLEAIRAREIKADARVKQRVAKRLAKRKETQRLGRT